jgi:hypothetical protein
MDNRSYEAAAAGTPPAAPASPSSGYPTNGNPGSTPATMPGAYWFHQLGEELRGIIAAAGITPSVSDLTQLLTALRSAGVFATQAASDNSTKVATTAWAKLGFVVSLAGNGYIKLPDWMGGWILQWGLTSIVNASAGTSYNFNFPIAFPNAAYAIFGSHINSNGTVLAKTNTTLVSTSQGVVSWDQTVTGGGSLAIYFITIGH